MVEYPHIEELMDKKTLHFNKLDLTKKNNKKMKWFKILFVLINLLTVLIVIAVELNKNDLSEVFRSLPNIIKSNYGYLILCGAMVLIIYFSEGFGFALLHKTSTGRKRISLGIRTSIVGRYGDGITPLASGGQPFQIYYLLKGGMPAELAFSIPLIKYMLRIFTADFIMIIFMITTRVESNMLITVAACIGLVFNMFMPILIMIFSINPKLGEKVLSILCKIAEKLKLTKNGNILNAKLSTPINEFLTAMHHLSSKAWLLLSLILLSAIEYLAFCSLPFFVCKALGFSPDYAVIVTSAIYVQNSASFIPTPGGSGVAEGAFYSVFASVLGDGMVFIALILWRFLTFFVNIIVGLFLVLMTRKESHKLSNIIKLKLYRLNPKYYRITTDDTEIFIDTDNLF